MKRTIETQLAEWMAHKRRKPLLVRGARQVGKTFSINEFGRTHFKNCVVFDLEQERSIHRIFNGDLHARALLNELAVVRAQRIDPGETLLFLDEIQCCPRALAALRYFYEEIPELHVIAAGSLLEFALESISFPVGRVEFLWMHPMTFSEFLLATGRELLEENRPGLNTVQPVSETLHSKLMDSMRAYFIVGGFPEAVRLYAETGAFNDVARIHQAIGQSYIQDFTKYSPRADRECLNHVFEAVPLRAGQQIKYAALYPEKRVETIKHTLRILERSLVIRRVTATSAQGLPLGAGIAEKVFKYVFADVGLMQHMSGTSAATILAAKNLLDTFRGGLAEQFIGQELLAVRGGSENDKLYYWSRLKRGSSAEVDYLMTREGRIIPIEVKSGPAGKLRSLSLFLAEHPHSAPGLVFHGGNAQDIPGRRMRFLPLYTNLKDIT